MKYTNINDNEAFKIVMEDGYMIHDGHPSFEKKWTDDINANKFAAELIKHNYRDGWSLPEMP